jgi:hypothetical protein
VDKSVLRQKIVAKLEGELELYCRAAQAARAEATDEQSKAESKYDTRGLEASYLARGQSRQAAELEKAIAEFRALPLREFARGEAIDVGALVELETAGERAFYFLGPRAGGTEIILDQTEVCVITPESPLGTQLRAKPSGARLELVLAGRRQSARIVSVQ